MTNSLLVPIYLDALYLPTETQVLEEMTDYSELPYYKGAELVKRDRAYLSETVLSRPFKQTNLTLKAGIHLHWSLPDALTNGIVRDGDPDPRIKFPLVPNRWLIIRRGGNKQEKIWVVESDYLYPEGVTQADAINILHQPANNEYQPYRFLGRKLELSPQLSPELSQSSSTPTNAQYIDELTAIGPFEKVDSLDNEKAAFAGFYPNCRSVFGFHDEEFQTATIPPKDLQYDVIGWYSDGTKDYLDKFIKEHSEENHPQSLLEILQDKAGWTVEIENNQDFPRRLLCHSSIKFKPGTSLTNPEAKKFQGKIAVGNTQEEAIAAYLANTIKSGSENPQTLEQQLQALQMSEHLEQQNLDFVAKFQAALHENSFIGQSKEIVWQVVPESNSQVSVSGNANPANAVQGEGQIQVALPSSIGDRINQVNKSQREYDQKLAKIGSIREQVYADWYKYIWSLYVNEEILVRDRTVLNDQQRRQLQNRRNSDLIKAFLEAAKKDNKYPNQYGLAPLEDEIKSTGILCLNRGQGEIISASAPSLQDILNDINNFAPHINNFAPNTTRYSFASDSSASRLAEDINTLIAQINTFNKTSRFIAPKNRQITVTGTDNLSVVADDITLKCLEFKGTNCQVSGLQNIRSISMWVKIEGVTGSLLDGRNDFANSWINSSHGIGSNWEKMYVNGQQIQSPLNWAQIPKNQWVLLYLQAKSGFSGTIHLMSNNSGSDRLQGRIASVIFHGESLSSAEIQQNYRDKIGLFRPSYIAKIVPGSRYWQAGDPVVFMTGDVAKSTRDRENERVREDELLQCQLLTKEIDLRGLSGNTLNDLKAMLEQFANQPQDQREKIGFREWQDQPWNPFLLEWQVQLTGLKHTEKSALSNEIREPGTNYHVDIFKNNYDLRVNGVEITPKNTISRDRFAEYPNLCSGASFLSSSAGMLLKENLTDYLKKYLLPHYYEAHKIPSDQQTEDFLRQNFDTIKGWYKQENPSASADDPIYTALRAYEQLQSLNCLAQNLGGFSDALLTYDRTMQLDVKDPLSFSSQPEQNFLKRVQDGLSIGSLIVPGSILRSPLWLFAFNPIRTGALKITNLRLVDTFGRVNIVLDSDNIQSTQIIRSQNLTPPSTLESAFNFPNPIYLPPRLTQPARLNFRWLSATQGEQEMNDSPTTSPICGWILPNNLDNSLTIYDSQGEALVVINRKAELQPIPGRDLTSEEIAETIAKTNPYLKQMVRYLRDRGEAFFTDFLTTVNKALETIDPEGFAQNQAISLLVARPLALVRSQVNLELQGIPAVSQNITSFSRDMFVNSDRTTNAFENVKFPIRIGEYQQFNDGLVGYWVEDNGTYKNDTFYAPQGCYVPHQQIKTLFDNATDSTPDTPINLEQTLEANTAQTLVMLIDPRGQINASCGVLPAKRISLPPEQYVPALQAISVTFLSAPLLSDLNPINNLDRINLSLPEVPSYEWSWLGKEGNTWSSRPLHPINSQPIFSSPQKIYDGWLKLSRKTEANE